GADLTVTVRREEVLQAPLEWAFGAGHKAVTPVGRVNGQYFEHRLSWYSAARRLALTPGHPAQPSPDVASALGVMQPPATISRCFNCHAAGVRSTAAGPDLTSMHPGVGCERCHGPGSEHIAQPSKGRLLNAGRFPARAVVEICGECHRSPNRTYSSPTPELDDPVSVRFQPVGFMASRCFSRSRTFSCLNCHDPHQDARPASDPSYAQVCQGCHGKPPGQRSRCARPARDCLSCHMKTSSPLPNLTFTDHRIRIYQD
ncbi:MAG: hypothetical protein HYR60_07355, partial [Acidobacteria bacterium]|nr:hypothetical protein [Acidobacteriota bacterium]